MALDRTPEPPRGKPIIGIIIIVVIVALTSLYRWNRRQVEEENLESGAQQRLCEVRSKQAGGSGICEYDENSKSWVAKP